MRELQSLIAKFRAMVRSTEESMRNKQREHNAQRSKLVEQKEQLSKVENFAIDVEKWLRYK